jgi:hypothetical protein
MASDNRLKYESISTSNVSITPVSYNNNYDYNPNKYDAYQLETNNKYSIGTSNASYETKNN